MGSSQSPSLLCQYGLSMLRSLVEREPAFQGQLVENSWWTHLDGGPHNPTLGNGLICMGNDGLPAALVWALVDDFKIHATTRAKLVTALNAFMDMALHPGMICQRVKTKPPRADPKVLRVHLQHHWNPDFAHPLG